ncbi:MAG: hypothetical protein HW378_205 [Anaerolineales bacterium]|nr:hypothetical protein [Anaerolineales bacterium]
MKKLVIFGQSYKPRGLARRLVGWRVERAVFKARADAKGMKGQKGQDDAR